MELLPDKVICKCMVRVPYTSHGNLKGVCRSWEGIVRGPYFYMDRNISGKSDKLICFIEKDNKKSWSVFVITIYDPLNDTWKRLNTPIDDPHFPRISEWSQCIAMNRKLVLITRARALLANNGTMKTVYIYDFESARWRRGADMPTARSFFACSASSSNGLGLVYVAGGMDENYNSLTAAETYNVEEDRWEILPPMIQQHGTCHGVFIESKFMVVQKFSILLRERGI